ncbi:MAG TPA: hypothetical protein PLN56_05035 [Methanoregulaceae archaeon]|nr:hypothetical protein [Methanoregulaceae archaeon]
MILTGYPEEGYMIVSVEFVEIILEGFQIFHDRIFYRKVMSDWTGLW